MQAVTAQETIASLIIVIGNINSNIIELIIDSTLSLATATLKASM